MREGRVNELIRVLGIEKWRGKGIIYIYYTYMGRECRLAQMGMRKKVGCRENEGGE